MKTQRRHELQKNELAEWLKRAGEKLKRYQNHILLAVIAILAVWLGVRYWRSSSSEATEASWQYYTSVWSPLPGESIDEYRERLRVGELDHPDHRPNYEDVARLHAGEPLGNMALLQAGDLYFDQGVRQLFTDRESAVEWLSAAEQHYGRLADGAGDDALLAQRGLLGLGKTYESLAAAAQQALLQELDVGAETPEELRAYYLEEARESYERLIERYPEGPFAGEAQARIESLDAGGGDFYAWLSEHAPPEPASEIDIPDSILPGGDDLMLPLPGARGGEAPEEAGDAAPPVVEEGAGEAPSGEQEAGATPVEEGDEPPDEGDSSEAPPDDRTVEPAQEGT